MPIVLFRVDDRLIHGQVVVGWGSQLEPDYILVVDDAIAVSDWERDLYAAGLPDSIEGRFLSVEGAVQVIPDWRDSNERGFVLTRDLSTMRRLAESGVLDGEEINIGGIHDTPGRRRVLAYVFLDDDGRGELARLGRARVSVSARDLPAARAVSLERLLAG